MHVSERESRVVIQQDIRKRVARILRFGMGRAEANIYL